MASTNWGNLVQGDDIRKIFRQRKIPYYENTIWESSLSEYEVDGWYKSSDTKTVSKTGVKKVKIRKNKPITRQFEDDVWTMFYKMGFHTMNRDENFTIYYDSSNPSFSQQIDVFAADEDTVLVVECKTAETRKNMTFKKPIESLGGNMQKIQNEIHKRDEFKDKKVRFIWATKNINLDSKDIDRLEGYNISYFDDDSIQYYTQLADHLGTAARYQLLGDIFSGIDIKNMDMRVPAIEGQMGGYTYYEFSIEPEKLLKIGYVLHHSMAISGQMETYQRIIKKGRLKQIRDFIDKGGYFPNSIIISVDTRKSTLQFDQAKSDANNKLHRIGTLHLPNRYHSAYIIDGQHRLYGYSETKYASTNAIPVVAFVNLDPHEQMKLFMDINENQKAVPKTLRVVLEGDLLWTDKSKSRQRDALRSKIAQQLGTDKSSPLHQRVQLSEDTQSDDILCVTVAAIRAGLKSTNFFSSFDKNNSVTKHGTFDKGDLTSTYNLFYPFIRDMLGYIAEKCQKEWSLGQHGILARNQGVQGCIRLINDIVNILIEKKAIDPLQDNMDDIYRYVEFYLNGLITYINNLADTERLEFMKNAGAGSGADMRYWRQFQLAVQRKENDFKPAGLSEYLLNETRQFNSDARKYIDSIEIKVKQIVKEKLQEAYGSQWLNAIPKKIYIDISAESASKNFDISNGDQTGPKTEPWDFVTLSDLQSIVTYGSNWSNLFEKILVRPEEKNRPGDKNVKTGWMLQAFDERKHMNAPNGASYSVKKATFDEIESVYNWLCR